jgi:uncharacterized membrane protein
MVSLGLVPDRARWLRFLSMVFLVLGAGFAVSGIFFFFAYNWDGLHRFAKLGLVQGLMLIALAIAYWRGFERLSGKIALTSAALLLGAVLAVVGQIYQTGADSYRLFAFWAVLILGWVAMSRFTPLWFVWVLLVNLALGLYWDQVLGNIDSSLNLVWFVINGSAAVVWEIARNQGLSWVRSRWTPRLLWAAAFFALLVPSLIWVIEEGGWVVDEILSGILHFLLIAASAAVLYYYSRIKLDLFILLVAAASLALLFNTWFGRIAQDSFELLLCGLALLFIGQAALIVNWLRKLAARQTEVGS